MNDAYIVDSHVHTGYTNQFFSPEVDAKSLLARMHQFHVRYAVNLSSMRALMGGGRQEMEIEQREYEESAGRLFYYGFYDPVRGKEVLAAAQRGADGAGGRERRRAQARRGVTTMRDPDRIDRILGFLRAYWKAHPDLRLGQIRDFRVRHVAPPPDYAGRVPARYPSVTGWRRMLPRSAPAAPSRGSGCARRPRRP